MANYSKVKKENNKEENKYCLFYKLDRTSWIYCNLIIHIRTNYMSQKLFAIDRMSVRNEIKANSDKKANSSLLFFLIVEWRSLSFFPFVCDNRSMQNWHVIVQTYPAKINPTNRSTCGDVEKREIGKSYITFIPIIILYQSLYWTLKSMYFQWISISIF